MKTQDIVLRDPFVLPYEGKYYLFGTRSFTCWEDHATGVDAYVSEDLENWSEPIEVLHKSDDFWANKCYWAPEVHVYHNKFYMFVTLSKAGTDILGTALFIADHPLGPYKSHGPQTMTPEDWRSLDGTFYQDKKGNPYMVFCHEWVQVSDGEMNVVALNEDLNKPIGEPKILFRASQGKTWVKNANFPREINNDYITDGPF
ncbi:MAG: family 43 glycosylhydrolase [Firmicutes bacterium]|nr:family 43 glycosylhydrolase [Bacillota bacterium]